MLRNVRLVTFLLVVLALLFGPAALTYAAGATNIDLQHALPISGQQTTFPANTVLWYSFQYPGGSVGNRPEVTVMLLNGNASHLTFKVWTPEQAANMSNQVAIGQGTPVKINCNIDICPSRDLVWQCAFLAGGIYYVEVFNNNANDVTATLTVAGSGVTSGPSPEPSNQIVAATTAPPNQIGAATTAPSNQGGSAPPLLSTAPTNVDLQHALPISDQQTTFPANTVLWYSFQYPGGSVGSRPEVTVTLLNGNAGHLTFKVWTPEQAANMTNQVAIGQGTPVKINCNIDICPSRDLVWQGAFLAGGIYYVEVFNNNANDVTGTLTVEGSGVTLSQ